MKIKQLYWVGAILLCMSVLLMSCEKETVLDVEIEVPSAVQSYISTHFPSAKIQRAVKEEERSEKELKVTLDNGVYLKFNGKNEIVDIESKTALPQSVIPAKIWNYVEANYPNAFILEWELDGNTQDVDLNTGVQLEFNLNGDFIRIDS